MKKIGIIGQGFVGGAVREGMKDYFQCLTYDINPALSNSNLEEMIRECKVIFMCLPTPMVGETGQCFTGIIEKSLTEVNEIAGKYLKENLIESEPIVVLKSTVPVGTTKRLDETFPNVIMTFNPEFLTEANAVEDFKNQNRIVVGGNGKNGAAEYVGEYYNEAFPDEEACEIIITDYSTAELVKYTTNCFLALKVSFANEMYDIAEALEVDYSKMVDIATLDTRLGKSHWRVPGPDGDRGYGGHCFPKDMAALVYEAEKLGENPTVLKAAINKNNLVRKDRDWEKQVGRAIV